MDVVEVRRLTRMEELPFIRMRSLIRFNRADVQAWRDWREGKGRSPREIVRGEASTAEQSPRLASLRRAGHTGGDAHAGVTSGTFLQLREEPELF